ncbi:UDP-N-acetylglucosamine 2-epimerase [Candidatus Nitromaritima sp. SCGC AAA799-A02]|nr:UDP-N-acetylglucosamine 2-epimerase [Candidatus Nitromaritima sp. SCGC AAA799-A02]
MRILNIVGTRPNFIKMAPLMEQMLPSPAIDPILLHTGQHYDENMSRLFFDQLKIPKPDFDLGVGSESNANQIGEIIKRVDPVLEQEKPDAVLVVGDVNSTMACALAASYREIPVFHVEAGLRSFDRSMPEEINRIVTDSLSDLLFVTEKSGLENLAREGIDSKKVHFVGNVMVDTLLRHKETAEQTSRALDTLKLEKRQYVVLTLHRPSNVDQPGILESVLQGVLELSKQIPVVFPIHPRTRKKISEFGLDLLLEPLILVEPQPYLDMVNLMSHARMLLTDSGGIQEETTILQVPCLTLRENTERPVTLERGTNTLVGTGNGAILSAAEKILTTEGKKASRPELWDGAAAQRILKILNDWIPPR